MTTTMAEPEWDQDTRDLALALDAMDTCGVCGRPASICQGAENEFNWDVGAPVRCHATTALRQAQKGFTEESNPHLDALMWPIRLREPRRVTP